MADPGRLCRRHPRQGGKMSEPHLSKRLMMILILIPLLMSILTVMFLPFIL